MSKLVDDIFADLDRRGLRSPTTEAQARAYAAASAESERLTAALGDHEPGTPAHKRVSTALRGVGRERDTLARHLGITEQGRARPVRGSGGVPKLADLRAVLEAQDASTK